MATRQPRPLAPLAVPIAHVVVARGASGPAGSPIRRAYEAGPLGEAIVFGAPVAWPEDTSPRIEHIVHDATDIERLAIPDPASNPRLKDFLRNAERFNQAARKMGVRLALNDKPAVGIHPPLSCACALMSPTTPNDRDGPGQKKTAEINAL